MACDRYALNGVAYARRFTIWHYKTTDSTATIKHADYFAPAADMLRIGDMIVCHASDDEFVHFFKGPEA